MSKKIQSSEEQCSQIWTQITTFNYVARKQSFPQSTKFPLDLGEPQNIVSESPVGLSVPVNSQNDFGGLTVFNSESNPTNAQIYIQVGSSNIQSRNILRFLFTIIYSVGDGRRPAKPFLLPQTWPKAQPSSPTFMHGGKELLFRNPVLNFIKFNSLTHKYKLETWQAWTLFGIFPIFFCFGTFQTANYLKTLQTPLHFPTVLTKSNATLAGTNLPPFPKNCDSSNMLWGNFVPLDFLRENLLRVPDYMSKIFIIWGLLSVWKGVRPQRKMFKEGTRTSSQTRIIWPNRPSGGLRRLLGLGGGAFGRGPETKNSSVLHELKGLTTFLPILETLIQSLKVNQGFWPTSSKILMNFSGNKRTIGGSALLLDKQKVYSPKGYLFVGPPGTGKTLLAQAIAREANVPLLCVSASEIQKQIEIGTRIGALRLRKLFDQARRLAPCILFLDEIDAIGRSRGNVLGPDTEFNKTSFGSESSGLGPTDLKLFTEFLIQMDSFSSPGIPGGFVVIGTTNFLSSLDSAFIRSGRFDRILGLNYPSKQVRIEILQWYTGISKTDTVGKLAQNQTITSSVLIPWNYLGYYTDGFSPADLSRLVNESLLAQEGTGGSSPVGFFGKSSPLHTFDSLQKGFNRIHTHKKFLR